MNRVDWINAEKHWPQEPGMYLTFWSDGSRETYPFWEEDIARGSVDDVCGAKLLFWAENVQPPEGFND